MSSIGGPTPGDMANSSVESVGTNDSGAGAMNKATQGARESGTGGSPKDDGGKREMDTKPPEKQEKSESEDDRGSRSKDDPPPAAVDDGAPIAPPAPEMPVLPVDGSVTSGKDQWKVAPPVTNDLDFLLKKQSKDQSGSPEKQGKADSPQKNAIHEFNKTALAKDQQTQGDASAQKPTETARRSGDEVTTKDRELLDAARKRLDKAFAPEDPAKLEQKTARPRLAEPSDLRVGLGAIDGGHDRNKIALEQFARHATTNVSDSFNLPVEDFVRNLATLSKPDHAELDEWLNETAGSAVLNGKTIDALADWTKQQTDHPTTAPESNRLTPVQDSGIGGANRSSWDTITSELRQSKQLSDFQRHWDDLDAKDVAITVAIKDTPWVMVVDKSNRPLGFFYGDGVGTNLPVGVHGMDSKRGGYLSLTDGTFRPAGQFMERLASEAAEGKYGVALKDRIQAAHYSDLKSNADANLVVMLRPDSNATGSPIGKVCDAVKMAMDHLGDETRQALGQLTSPEGIATLSAAMLSKTVMKALGLTFAVELMQAAGIAGYAKTQFEKEFASRLIAKHLGMIAAGGGLMMGAKLVIGRIRAAIASRFEGRASKSEPSGPGPEANAPREVIGDRRVSGSASTEPRIVIGDQEVSPSGRTQPHINTRESPRAPADHVPGRPRGSEIESPHRPQLHESGHGRHYDQVKSEFHQHFGGDARTNDVWQTLRPHLGRNAAEISANEAIFKEMAAAHKSSADGEVNIMAWAISAAKMAQRKGLGLDAAAKHLQAEGYLLRQMKSASAKDWADTKAWHAFEPDEHPAQIFSEAQQNKFFEIRWDHIPKHQKIGDSRMMVRTYRQAEVDAAQALKRVMDPMTREGIDFLKK